jgi:hypothetical protein
VKKLFAIAFTCVYLTLAVGVVQTTHYCMGRVKSSVLFSFDSVKCPCFLFAKEGNKKCCTDEHEVIKIEDDHAVSNVISIAPEFFVVGEVVSQVFSIEPREESLTVFDESPPLPDPIPLFTKHCSLVFYDSMMS